MINETPIKEQWDYVGKERLPEDEPIMVNRDVYGVWINPYTKEKMLIIIEDRSKKRI